MMCLKRFLILFLWASVAFGQGLVNGGRGLPQPNDTVTGTTQAGTAIINSSGNAINAGTTNTTVKTYIVLSPTSTSAGNAILATGGLAPCTMDSTIASGAGNYYVVNSTTTAKQCHAQSTAPAYGVWVIGFLYSSSTVSGSTSLVEVNGFSSFIASTIGSPSAGIYAYLSGITLLGSQFGLYTGSGTTCPAPSGGNTTGWCFPGPDGVPQQYDGTAMESQVNRGGTSASFTAGHLLVVGSPYYEDADSGILDTSAGLLAAIGTVAPANSLTGIHNFSTSSLTPGGNAGTFYYLAPSALTMPATYLTGIKSGTTMRWRVQMSKTAAGTGAFNIRLYSGINGSISDTTLATQSVGTATAALDDMVLDVVLTFTSTTAAYWTISCLHSAATATGFGCAIGSQGFSGTLSGLTTTTASLIFGLGYSNTTGTAVITVPMVQAEAIGVN